MRQGDWKLHEYFEDGALELYNLKDDPGEKTNLADSNSEITIELHAKMKKWREQINAPVPTEPNPRYDANSEAAAIAKKMAKVKR